MGLMSPAKHQWGVGLSCQVSHRNSHSQACCTVTVASRLLDIPQNSHGALWEGDSSVSGGDNLGKEADPAKKKKKSAKLFAISDTFQFFQTNNVFIEAMPNSTLL